jgi:tetratricopeptide (TPR) repeat protein
MKTARRPAVVAMLVCLNLAGPIAPSRAQPSAPPSAAAMKDAEMHFRRGVALYKDGDSAGALVEFRRAYELSPNYRLLYNIGQTYYQLQRYAEALKALRSYLGAGGTRIPSARRTSVEADIHQLETHVANLEVKVNVDGAQVTVDDEPAGTSPLAEPLLLSIGRRKISAMKQGLTPVVRFVDLVAGDRASVALELQPPAPAPAPTEAPPPLATAFSPEPSPPKPPPTAETPRAAPASPNPPWVLWGATGVLVAATVVTGVLTISARNDLSKELDTYPANPDQIDQKRNQAKTLAIATDVLGGAAAVAAGIALYVTLTRRSPGDDGAGVRVGVGPAGVELRGRY